VGPQGQDAALAPMFGRSAEKAALIELLADERVRLVTVTGRGGIGKTRLVTEVTRALNAPLGQPVVFVSLAGVVGPERVTAEIAAHVGLPAIGNVASTHGLVERLRHEQLLLVLDNFEHVLGATPDVAFLLDACDQLRILVTSQARLGIGGERVFDVSPLPVPDPAERDVALLASCPSVALYCDRAAAVDRAFVLSDTNAAAVGELCWRLEGLPLAIELAAARAVTLPAAEIVRHFDTTGLTLLRSRRIDTPARHKDLQATIEWTYHLLAPGEQHVLRRLSLLSGTFDLDAVVALSDAAAFADVVDHLESLVDLHLVDRVSTSNEARFLLPVSIRMFGREQLEAVGEFAAANREHIAYRAAQARAAAAAIFATDDSEWLDVIRANHDDFVGALVAALDAAWPEAALELVVGLAHLWSIRGYYAAQEALFERVLDLARSTDPGTPAYATALVWSAQLGVQQRPHPEPDVLLPRLQHGEDLARKLQDDSTLLRALIGRMVIAPFILQIPHATAISTEALELAEHMGDDRHLGQVQAWSGMLAQQRGDDSLAVELGRAAVARARASGDQRTLVLATMLLLPLQRKHPDIAADVPSPEEALRAARAAGLALYEALLLPMTVGQYCATHDIPTTLFWAKESLTKARTMPESPAARYSLVMMVSVAAELGDDERAAFFHGTVRDQMAALSRAMAPHELTAHNRTLERVQCSLGPHHFEAAAKRGAQLAPYAGIRAALDYVHDAILNRNAAERRDDAVPVPASPSARTQPRREVLTLLVEGLGNKEIAAKLDISPKTVMHHTTTLYQILGVRGRAEAVAVAIRKELIS
jgi:predicted ATPase/DNA-binding CsgD family transcriptional regulator